jgi:hypothetical protein
MKSILYFSSIFLAICLTGASCSKEFKVVPDENTTFVKKYGSDNRERFLFVETLNNGNIIGAYQGLDHAVGVYVLDPHGAVIRHDSIPIQGNAHPQGLKLPNGGIVIGNKSSTDVLIFDPEGKLLYQNAFNPSLPPQFLVSEPIVNEEGSLFICYSDGVFDGIPSLFVQELNSEGVPKRLIEFNQDSLDGAVTGLRLLRVAQDTFWLTGDLLPQFARFAGFPFKSFFSKVKVVRTDSIHYIKHVVVNENNRNFNERLVTFTHNKDNSMLIVTSPGAWFFNDFPTTASNVFEVHKVDENLETLWNKIIDIGALQIWPTKIRESSKGGYVISGFCLEKGLAKYTPFAVKLTMDGNIEMQRIFTFGGQANFFDGVQLENGDFVFGGAIDGFGNFIQVTDNLIVRTHENGSYD